jgi:hypothetical protein
MQNVASPSTLTSTHEAALTIPVWFIAMTAVTRRRMDRTFMVNVYLETRFRWSTCVETGEINNE